MAPFAAAAALGPPAPNEVLSKIALSASPALAVTFPPDIVTVPPLPLIPPPIPALFPLEIAVTSPPLMVTFPPLPPFVFSPKPCSPAPMPAPLAEIATTIPPLMLTTPPFLPPPIAADL